MDTFEELMAAVLAILPSATFGDDFEGQIIIYTNKMLVRGLTREETTDIVEMPDVISE